VATKLCELFRIDLRSLAAFRIGIAALVLVDLATRAPHIEATLTDTGVMPVAFLHPGNLYLTLHALSGSYAFEVGMFVFAAVAASLLLVGYFSRVSAMITWVLVVSLHNRNIFLNDGVDVLFRTLLFWGMFLPLGRKWAIDARGKPAPSEAAVLSPATVALLLQFALFYVTCGLLKSGDEWHGTKDAIEIALRQSYWVRPFGEFLLGYPELLRVLTPTVAWFETLAPLLLFLPFWTPRVRMLVLVGFWGMMVGLGSSLHLNLMPWISSAATLPFLPASFWQFIARRARSKAGASDGSPASDSPRPQNARFVRLPRPQNAWFVRAKWSVVVLLIAHFAVTVPSAFGSAEQSWLKDVGQKLGLNLVWKMYAHAPSEDYEFDVVATLQNGSVVHVLGPDGPEHIRRAHDTYRIKYYMERLPHFPTFVKRQYAAWLASIWDAGQPPPRRFARVRVFVIVTPIKPPGPPQRRLIVDVHRGD
jgi:hypothetical protein